MNICPFSPTFRAYDIKLEIEYHIFLTDQKINQMILLILGNWFGGLTGTEQIFWGISIVFSILFLIQFVLSLVGLDFDTDVDVDISTDVEGGDFSIDPGFTLFSVRSIIAFFTFFGWAGVLTLNSGGSTLMAVIAASISGFAAMSIVGYMLYLASKLTESATVDMGNALYQNGEVYLSIPERKSGQGKIHINIQGSLRELEAITEGEALPNGAKIRVVEILDDNLLLVEPVSNFLLDENDKKLF